MTDEGFNVKIELAQIDPNLPLFIKSDVQDIAATRLFKDRIFRSSIEFSVSEGVDIDLDEDCENNLCTGLFVGIEIPDSLNQGKVLRENHGTVGQWGDYDFSLDLCSATEKFDTSYLKEFIIKISFKNSSFTFEDITLFRATNYESEPNWGDYRIYDIEAPEWAFQDTSYNLSLENIADGYNNFLLMYADSTYPSPEHISYINARPLMNQSIPQTINLFIYGEQTLVFQPYARIRGGLVEGGDSIRHEFNLVNNGGNMCLEEFVEVIIVKSNTYLHKSGDINFHGSSSCLMFRDGGELEVAKEAYFQYGDGGEGILGLGERSKVVLGEGSTLAIDNRVVLLDKGDNFEEQVKVDLKPGSALIFEDNAKILRAAGDQSRQMINVYMNGGLLDDHRLSDAERAMINKIYPEINTIPFTENDVLVYPNPVGEVLTFRYNSPQEQTVSLEIVNVDGQVIYKKTQLLIVGLNDVAVDFKTYSSGIFVLRLNTVDGIRSQKFIK